MDYPKEIFVVKNSRNPFGMGEWNGEAVYQDGVKYVRADTVKEILSNDPLIKKFLDSGFWDAHHADLHWRHNGKDKMYQADWLKSIWYLVKR